MSADKDIRGKASFYDSPLQALPAIARVAEFGRRKYSAFNWLAGAPASRVLDSVQRHLLMWWSDGRPDHESGESHLAHVAWWAMVGLVYERLGMLENDRPGFTDSEKDVIMKDIYKTSSEE